MKGLAATLAAALHRSFLLFALFLAATFTGERFFHALFFAWLQVKGVSLHFLDDVFLLHLPLESTQSVF